MTINELKTKSTDELKVLAYDTIAQVEGGQQALKVINDLIAEKSNKESVKESDKKELTPKKN